MKSLSALIFALSCTPAFADSFTTKELPTDLKTLHTALGTGFCNETLTEEPQVYQLSEGGKLYILVCMAHAYQASYFAYTENSYGEIKPVTTLSYDPSNKALITDFWLIDASYDEKTKTLYSHSRSGGGNCGQSSKTTVTADKHGRPTVLTKEIRFRGECDDNWDAEWPVVFEQ